MTGSYSGSRPNVLAKQPFSVVYTRPPGISATKSSWAGRLPRCVVNVVVVLPVPDRPTISIVLFFLVSSLPLLPLVLPLVLSLAGKTLQPACRDRPPRWYTMLFHIRRPPFLDSPK